MPRRYLQRKCGPRRVVVIRRNRQKRTPMTAENFVDLIEEMMDVKLQQRAESNMKPTPEIAGILAEKRMTDTRRLKQIRAELIRTLSESEAPTRQWQGV
jgi:hypothetical protein